MALSTVIVLNMTRAQTKRITEGLYHVTRPSGVYKVEKLKDGWVVTYPDGTKSFPAPTKGWAMTTIPSEV